LTIFGEEIYYGVETVELVTASPQLNRLPLGRLVAPGRIVLYDQAPSPWRLGFSLAADERARLLTAGADLDEEGVVAWPGETLRRFMLAHVLAHELGTTCFSTNDDCAASVARVRVNTRSGRRPSRHGYERSSIEPHVLRGRSR